MREWMRGTDDVIVLCARAPTWRTTTTRDDSRCMPLLYRVATDDDMHHPRHLSGLACPISRGETEVTALAHSYFAMLSADGATFYRYGRSRAKPFLGTIAFARDTASHVASIWGATFTNTSLAEDLSFVERAIRACHRFSVIDTVPIVYTRHLVLNNTYRADFRTVYKLKPSPTPSFVSPALLTAFINAEGDFKRRGVFQGICSAPLHRHAPPGLARPDTNRTLGGLVGGAYCCSSSRRMRRSCPNSCVHACMLHWDCRRINVTCTRTPET